MALPTAQHFYFKSANGRYRVHIGTKGSLVMASCQGVSRLKMDVQKLMVERKHFGLKIHLLHGSREIVELIFFTNRAEVKEVRVRMDGKDIPTTTEAVYRAELSAPSSSDVGAATMVKAPPGMGLAADLSPPGNLPSPESDEVLDRLAILTGSGEHPAVGRVSGGVPISTNSTPSKGIRIDPSLDIVPPILGENEPTPAHALPAVPAIAKPGAAGGVSQASARSGLKPALGGSGVKPAAGTSGLTAAAKSGVKPTPAQSGIKIAARSGIAAAAESSLNVAASPAAAQTPPAAKSPAAAASPVAAAETGVKVNKNAVHPEGKLQVPEGLDELLAAADENDRSDEPE